MRLQKHLASLGVASRRESERWIAAGRVKVNGQVVTIPGTKVTSEDLVEVDGKQVGSFDRVVWMLHKPSGTLCTRTDPQERATVYDHLPRELPYLGHVGRLDYNTEGLLLFTNDGHLSRGLLDPRSAVPRVYEVKIRGRLSVAERRRIETGIPLDGQTTRPVTLERMHGHDSKHDWLRLTLLEGKNRHIHRIMEAVGHSVTRLRRVAFANLSITGLREGESRPLDDGEISALAGYVDSSSPSKPRR